MVDVKKVSFPSKTICSFINSIVSLKIMELPRFDDDDNVKELSFVTNQAYSSDFTGINAPKYHDICTDGDEKINLRDISVFLNEKDELIFRKCVHIASTPSYFTFTYRNNRDTRAKMKIRVYSDWTLSVSVTLPLLVLYGVSETRITRTLIGSQNRRLKKPRFVSLLSYSINLKFSKLSTISMYNNLPILFFDKSDFSFAFHYFVKHIFRLPYELFDNTPETKNLFDYYNSWVGVKKRVNTINSLESFIRNINGYLHLQLVPYSENDKLETIQFGCNKYSVLGGIYVSPLAKSIFTDNRALIDGLMLDTTWRTINKYVTSILMCVSHNVGISVAFAFGGSEDKDLYNMFIDTFRTLYRIDIKGFNVESDQGSALRSVCDSFDGIHLACLRHFKVSLKTYKFSHQISNLISVRSQKELDTLMKLYSDEFALITDPLDKRKLGIQLHKVGLVFDNGELKIDEEEKWNKVSMLARIPTRMPSTTNSLEATHGHLNELVQRRNTFWTSLFRLARSIHDRDISFRDHLKHTYQRIKRNVTRRARFTEVNVMRNEIAFFNSTNEKCECGEMALESSMMRIQIPCSHMVSCGAEFPPLPDVDLYLYPCWSKGTFSCTRLERENEAPPMDKQAKLKESAIKSIKRYSHYRNKAEIREFVERNFDDEQGYALGKPVNFYRLTHKGIVHFSNLNRKPDDLTTSDKSDVIDL